MRRTSAGTAPVARPDKTDYLMQLAQLVATRSTCDRKRVGAVLATQEGHVLSTGYNGSVPGAPHCDDVGHLLERVGSAWSCIRTTHAEINAVAFAARRGAALEGSCLYVTHKPCHTCVRAILAAGVRRVVFQHEGSDTLGRELLENAHVPVVRWTGEIS